ncbi:MAG: LysM peptidoglycan-binding domain-containing protein [Anaerolineales bacterium]|nr:LysM peptidoglycan-binding domain-containing protein [Anaerolineales bacterium]
MYATTGNFCHRVDPAEPVTPAYQGVVCLKISEFPSCPVYKQTWKGNLPAEIRGEPTITPGGGSRILLVVVLVVFLAAVGLFLVFGRSMISDVFAGLQAGPADVQVEGAAAIGNPTDTPAALPTETEALVLEVLTLAPTGTATPTITDTPGVPTLGPDLMTPFGPDAFLLLHRVLENESLPMIAEYYGTTTEVLRAANGFGERVNLRPGDVLVVPIDRKNAASVDVYQPLLVERDTTLQDLAFRYSTTEDTLRLWNSLGSGDIVPAGRWLVVPLIGEERQYPTATPTPLDWAALAYKGPFGPEDEFVLHLVQSGENLSSIMQIYNTTKEVTWVLNGFEEFVIIQPGQVMLLMPSKQDLENVQRFQLVLVAQDTNLNELAEDYGLTASILADYNDLTGEMVPANTWLVIP